ncbi:hypothetical protein Kpol_365p8 [Vanderwaltozyma polyspora DSM 70294]|uniref:GTP-binding protein 8 n=1 Tax=Vanderwaltozyma polyspora (strain ATCC 22028 / DSM 70294 / BCRC 21397 / CBS 2163 / NBRC 10782 / NRRL Y-8283 / UCD 57-17) TaxID=436907 RepID=A7TS05_VANPO|nr:uncharacterized protein Kpol_365p8 [Vanderwaltozyma polyspora DSM 70294]EDO14952.1 hypothetical protein Kpol_365p8 [Vanderwaltozyma polyspora DSM 70294]
MKVSPVCLYRPSNYVKYNLSLIKDIVSTKTIRNTDDIKVVEPTLKINSLKKQSKKGLEKEKKSNGKPEWTSILGKYNNLRSFATQGNISFSNRFFYTANIKYEWSAFKENEFINDDADIETNENLVEKNASESVVKEKLRNVLPEIAFLGSSNVGKSSLLNSLLTNYQKSTLDKIAWASKRPGFTKSLNFFNIGNRFRLVDTPGYGYNSTSRQGNLTLHYLKNRKELIKCFLLISAEKGLNGNDMNMIEFMAENGVPFELVFTKMDKLKNVTMLEKQIEDNNIMKFPSSPQLLFTNSEVSKKCRKRYGVDYVRLLVLQSAGLPFNVKPLTISKV